MKFIRDEIRSLLSEVSCGHCGARGAAGVIAESGPHCAAARCKKCDRVVEWIAWPSVEGDAKKRLRSRRIGLRENGSYCELCLRSRDEVPPRTRFDVHHIVEVQDGGGDDPENLQTLCSGCHAIVHWLRTYFGHYRTEEPS